MLFRYSIIALLAFAVQLGFGYFVRDLKPYWSVLDPPPTRQALTAAAFGDDQFLYRVLVSELQTGGDRGGRIVPIKDYDVDRIIAWLDTLDTLDSRAHHHIALAMRLFSLSQRLSDLLPLVRYAQRHVALNPELKLQWLAPAIMIAEVRLKDLPLAIEVAKQLAEYDYPHMNPVSYQLAPLLLAKHGDYAEALAGMRQALARAQNRASQDELQFMREFIAAMEAKVGATSPPG